MSVEIEFIKKTDNIFILHYGTDWPDGNGFYDKCMISFLFVKGIMIAKKAVIYRTGKTFVALCPDWMQPKKRIEFICKFLKEGKTKIEQKLKDKDETYSIRKHAKSIEFDW